MDQGTFLDTKTNDFKDFGFFSASARCIATICNFSLCSIVQGKIACITSTAKQISKLSSQEKCIDIYSLGLVKLHPSAINRSI